jgi:hypothetical protein
MIVLFVAFVCAGCSSGSREITIAEVTQTTDKTIEIEEADETATSSQDSGSVLDENSDEGDDSKTIEGIVSSNSGNWSESTHSKNVEPDYDVVFNQTEVLEFNIVIDSADWQAMQDDLEDNISVGKTNTMGRGGVRQPPTDDSTGDFSNNMVIGDDRQPPTGSPVDEVPPNKVAGDDRQLLTGSPEGEDSQNDYDPIWVQSSVTFDDITWDHVGIRFKGNSSLKSAVSSGNNKLSFKLDFDEFEDEYLGIEDQRFYGFKQLNLNNNYSDESLMREKVAADLFREFGLAAAQTTFCAVYVDYGEGNQFFGVYTLVEEMDDTGIEKTFSDDSGNLYKPDGSAASFAIGTYDEDELVKKNNEDEGDYSDVLALYEIINSDDRETDVDSWKSDLEEVFNVDGFLKWLAANTVMQNWDTYGIMTHNYFLYNNPETSLLNWIPWDNNEAFSSGKGGSGALSLDLEDVKDDWPLIRNLIDDSTYKIVYDGYVKKFVDEVFSQEKMTETYNDYFEMIKEYAYEEVSGYTYIKSDQSFDSAVEELKSHVEQRNIAVQYYLTN